MSEDELKQQAGAGQDGGARQAGADPVAARATGADAAAEPAGTDADGEAPAGGESGDARADRVGKTADEGQAAAVAPKPVLRQWVSLSEGSCDVRIGAGALDNLASYLGGSVSRPDDCALVLDDAVSDDLAERVRRQLTDGGYRVTIIRVPHEGCRTISAVGVLVGQIIGAHVTSDDLVCVVGGADAVSLCSHVAGQLFGKTPLAIIPTDLDTLVECVVTPRGIDAAHSPEALRTAGCAKTVVFDTEAATLDAAAEPTMLARAFMVSTAMCDGEKSFSALWDRAPALVGGDREVLVSQLMESMKSRGHLVASSSVAIRQSAAYGRTFCRALEPLTGAPVSTLLAEALRFQARMAAGMGKFKVDDVLAQDELLETLGLPTIQASLDPDEMAAAIKNECFRTSNRFLLCLPQALGRVRLTAIDDDLLHEHCRAWCASRAEA